MTPKIAIVGRPNVGKSSLLNLLAGRRVSIVDAVAGVTRDRVATYVDLPPATDGDGELCVQLIDTGGHGIEDADDLTVDIEQQIAFAVAEADVVLFVVDAQQGIAPLDQRVARLLRTSAGGDESHSKPVLLIANKVDSENHEGGAYEALQLGFGEPVFVSAANGYNKWELFTSLRETCDALIAEGRIIADAHPDEGVRLAIVGKRNAGKSTLVNTLVGDDRVIVSEIEGTTRDSVDVRIEFGEKVFTAIDTAGVRKRKSMKQDIEYYSHHRALRSIRRADVCVLMIDAAVPVSQVDKQLGNEILKHHKPTIVVINKWDLVEDKHTQEEYLEYLDDALKGFSFAPIAFLSALEKDGTEELLAMAANLHEQAGHRVGTGELNRAIEAILAERTPVSKGGKRLKIYYVSQVATNPPTIVFFLNDPDIFDNNFERFVLNRMRDELPYSEVPINVQVRARTSLSKAERAAIDSD